MTAHVDHSSRRLIPRWRLVKDIPVTAELEGDPRTVGKNSADPRFLQEKITEWQAKKTVGAAADALACGVVTRRLNQVRSMADFLLTRRSRLPDEVQNLAEYVLKGDESPSRCDLTVLGQIDIEKTININRATIRTRRAQLRENPRNVLAWLDMSRGYASLGVEHRAVRTMDLALSLFRDHRLVLRSAARLFVHFGHLDRAQDTLTRNRRTTSDPWLLASELAVATIRGKTSRHMKRALRIVNDGDFSSKHLTELHSAIGTIKFMEGRMRKSRQYFRHSLEEPTDNTLAQANWADRSNRSLGLGQLSQVVPRSFEANCWRALADGQWNRGMEECGKWLLDEPFSSRPACLGSYIGNCLVGDYKFAEMCARIGLSADPHSRALRNNLAVALAFQDRVAEAEGIFSQIKYMTGDGCPEFVYMATSGLLRFRKGDAIGGREFYLRSESEAPRNMKAAVAIHRALEERRLGTDVAQESLARAKELSVSSDGLFVRRLYEQHLGGVIWGTGS